MRLPYKSCGNLVSEFLRDIQRSFFEARSGLREISAALPAATIRFLGTIAPTRQLAWDCGTGNGQAAVGLASVFDCVIATDASQSQIQNAQPHERVKYRLATAEKSGLQSGTVDLIMVAQALHWFDLDRFYAEARRVLKPNGVLSASVYNLLHIEPTIDEVVNRYYYEVVGPFWPPERRLVEQFADLPLPFQEIDPPRFEMTVSWDLDHLAGYLRTWSSTQRFIAEKNSDPLEQIMDELRVAWADPQQTRKVTWPLIVRIGGNPSSGARKCAAHKVQPSRKNA